MTELLFIVVVIAAVLGLLAYMLAQKSDTAPQTLIHEGKFEEAVKSADELLARSKGDSSLHLHKAEALKLLGRFDEAIGEYQLKLKADHRDAAAREGVALCLSFLGRDLDEARRLMEETMLQFPEIQEFQAISLAHIHLIRGEHETARRLFDDNAELVETRFSVDYTDRDPLLAETLYIFAELTLKYGTPDRALPYLKRVQEWAPASIFASWAADAQFKSAGVDSRNPREAE